MHGYKRNVVKLKGQGIVKCLVLWQNSHSYTTDLIDSEFQFVVPDPTDAMFPLGIQQYVGSEYG
jgi:hypothetical protein